MTWMRESKVFFWWCSGMISVSSMYSLCANLTKALMQWMYESISTSRTSSFPDRGKGVERFKQRETMLTTKTPDELQHVEIHRASSPGHSKSVCVMVKVSVDLKVCVVIQVCVSGVFRNEGVCVFWWRCVLGGRYMSRWRSVCVCLDEGTCVTMEVCIWCQPPSCPLHSPRAAPYFSVRASDRCLTRRSWS